MIIPPSFPSKGGGLANAALPSTTTFKKLRAFSPPLAGAGGWTLPRWRGLRGGLSPSGGGWEVVKKYPVRDYLSVETRWKQGWRHAVGMPPLLDAFLWNASVVEHSFSTERYIPTECCATQTITKIIKITRKSQFRQKLK